MYSVSRSTVLLPRLTVTLSALFRIEHKKMAPFVDVIMRQRRGELTGDHIRIIFGVDCVPKRSKRISNETAILILDGKKCTILTHNTNYIMKCSRGSEYGNFHSQPGLEVRHPWSAWEVQHSSEQLNATPHLSYHRGWCQAARFIMGIRISVRRRIFNGYSISQEICTRFLLCCALLWLYIDWFSHIHQAYFTGTVAI